MSRMQLSRTPNPALIDRAVDTSSFHLLDSIALPCAVFDASDQLRFANEAFHAEFNNRAFTSPGTNRSDFVGFFHRYQALATEESDYTESNIPKACLASQEEVYDPESSQSYLLHWRRLSLDTASGWIVTLQNLTETRSNQARSADLQEQLMLTSRRMSVGEMATTIAHELNQPLGAILNYLGVARTMLEQQDVNPRSMEAIGAAALQAERATAVIARIREFVRNRETIKERCQLPELVNSVVSLLSLEIRQQRVRVSVQVADDLPSVEVDRIMMELVLANLVRNALDAMEASPPDRRYLDISANLDAEGRVAVTVRDTGCGIPSDAVLQLFQPFFSSKKNGMGAGLAICRSIMEFHGGHLYFEPSEQQGAAFVCCLPVSPSTTHLNHSTQDSLPQDKEPRP